MPSFTKSPTSQDKFHSYMMIKTVVDRFLSTGSVHICSQNQNIPVQTANGHSAACPRPRWGGGYAQIFIFDQKLSAIRSLKLPKTSREAGGYAHFSFLTKNLVQFGLLSLLTIPGTENWKFKLDLGNILTKVVHVSF